MSSCWECHHQLDEAADRTLNGSALVHICAACASPRWTAKKARQRWFVDLVEERQAEAARRRRRVATMTNKLESVSVT